MKKKFKTYKQQIISHTNLTISETEKYINNAHKKKSARESLVMENSPAIK